MKISAKELELIVERQFDKMFVAEADCRGASMHDYKTGEFVGKEKRGSYSLDREKVPKSCGGKAGQGSRKKQSTKLHRDYEPCGRKNRKKYCRSGKLKEAENGDPAEQGPSGGATGDSRSLGTPTTIVDVNGPLEGQNQASIEDVVVRSFLKWLKER